MQFSHLSHDLVDYILTLVPSFTALSAVIRTSKGVYTVFNARQKSIVRAVAENVVGHPGALPAALRMVRREIHVDTDDDCFDDEGNPWCPEVGASEAEVMQVPLSRREACRLDECTSHLRVLLHNVQLFMTYRHKDRTSARSQLTEEECLRFRRAMYRFWMYCNLYEVPEYDFDHVLPRNYSAVCVDFLHAIPVDELYELARAAVFVAETFHWGIMARCYTSDEPIESRSWYRNISALGPHAAWEHFVDMDVHITADVSEDGFFWNAYSTVLGRLEVKVNEREEKLAKAILGQIPRHQDSCDRCHAVRGNDLWGTQNWDLLRGDLNQLALIQLFPGNLRRNPVETKLFLIATDPAFLGYTYVQMMEQLFALPSDDSPGDAWSRDGSYCLGCVQVLFTERLLPWWYQRRRAGICFAEGPLPTENCWYGYNCRTMMHREAHAKKLNHLCAPTRGDGVVPNTNSNAGTAVNVDVHGA